jgi:hypothetical protein
MKKIIFAFFLLLAVSTQAQQMGKEYFNWYFGGLAAITFNTPNLEPISIGQSKMMQLEGSASISDKNGNLLFYTDGVNVWDRINNQMPEGRKLGGHSSSTQTALILRQPDSKNLYYIFTVGKGPYLEITKQEFNYSIVDLEANLGYGDVIEKNTLLHNLPVTEKLTAILHSNNEDYWVIAHEMDSPRFIIALLTRNGIEYVKTQSIGPSHDAGSGLNKDGVIGQMKANRKGDRLAAVVNTSKELQLFKFDRQIGELSDFVAFTMDTIAGYYGLEFSASGQFVYVSNANSRLLQFDVSSYHRATIEATRKSIYDIYPTLVQSFGQMQIGPNNKIYLAIHEIKYLGVINKPDLPGNQCNFNYTGLRLTTGGSTFGLPNFLVTEYEYRLEITSEDVCIGDTINFSAKVIPSADEYRYVWRGPNSFYSESQNIAIANSRDFNEGYYVLEVFEFNHIRFKDSVYITVHPFPEVEIVGTDTICPPEIGNLKIKKRQAGVEYLWSTGEIGEEIFVDSPGIYHVTAISKAGCISEDSFNVFAGDNLAVKIIGQNLMCEGESITLSTDKNTDNEGEYTYLWSTGESSPEILVSMPGNYSVTVFHRGGCTGTDEFTVEIAPIPEVELSHEGTFNLCVGEEMDIWVIDPIDENTYFWHDGITDLTRKITQTGIYKIYVVNEFDCKDSAEVEIIFHEKPIYDIVFYNDLIFCKGDSVIVTVEFDSVNETILWSDGFSESVRTIRESGVFPFRITNQYGCYDTASFEVQIIEIEKPEIIPTKYFVCADDTLTLFAVGNYYSYLWSDGNTSPSIVVKGAGKYKLIVQNEIGCIDSAEIIIEDISVGISFSQDLYEGSTVCTGTESIIGLTLRNDTQTETTINELILDDYLNFRIISPEVPFSIAALESRQILIKSYSESTGIFETQVTAISEEPCYTESLSKVQQKFTSSNIVRLPEITTDAGASICIPIYGKISCGTTPLDSRVTLEIIFDAEYFNPISLTSGTNFTKVIENGICKVKIEYGALRLTDSEEIIDMLCGVALVGRVIPTELAYGTTDWHDSLITTEKINGSLTLEACVIDLRPIKYIVPATLLIAPNPASETVELTITTEQIGLHIVDIFDLNGMKIASIEFVNSDNSQKINIFSLYSSEFKNGFYIICLKSPNSVIIEKLIIEN